MMAGTKELGKFWGYNRAKLKDDHAKPSGIFIPFVNLINGEASKGIIMHGLYLLIS